MISTIFKNAAQGIIPEKNPGGCTNPGNPPMSERELRKKVAIGAAAAAILCGLFKAISGTGK